MCAAGSNIHLLLEGGGGGRAAPALSVTITEEGSAAEEERAEAAPAAAETAGTTPEIVPLSARTKEGLAELVRVIRAQQLLWISLHRPRAAHVSRHERQCPWYMGGLLKTGAVSMRLQRATGGCLSCLSAWADEGRRSCALLRRRGGPAGPPATAGKQRGRRRGAPVHARHPRRRGAAQRAGAHRQPARLVCVHGCGGCGARAFQGSYCLPLLIWVTGRLGCAVAGSGRAGCCLGPGMPSPRQMGAGRQPGCSPPHVCWERRAWLHFHGDQAQTGCLGRCRCPADGWGGQAQD